jgi:hypothetical protein
MGTLAGTEIPHGVLASCECGTISISHDFEYDIEACVKAKRKLKTCLRFVVNKQIKTG